MDMRIGSDQIRSHVAAQTRIAKQELPEESRRLVLRLPTDSINFSPASRALQRGRLRVGLEEDGSGQYTKVTDANSNPMMPLLEEGMNAVKKNLDEMKELTALMEDEDISSDDRYATQMRLVELEGELEKNLYALNKKYEEMGRDQKLPISPTTWGMAEDQADSEVVLNATGTFDSRNFYIADRATGEVSGYSEYAAMIDKRTELKKEALERIRMRELDPEAWAKYEEELRETFLSEFSDKADENGYIPDIIRGRTEPKELIIAPEKVDMTYHEAASPEPGSVTLLDAEQTSLDDFAQLPIFPEVDQYEYARESYVEERLAELAKGDYEELNGMRVSVMSAELAKESGDFVENLTNQLTAQFQDFAAKNELISTEEASPEQGENRMKQIADIAKNVMNFLKKTVLGGIQKMAIREEGDNYDRKAANTQSPMNGVRDIFAPVKMTAADLWQMHRPDLFGNAEA